MIFFLHIPKTAGTTFYEVVKKNHAQFIKPKIEDSPLNYLNNSIIEDYSAIRLPGGYKSAPQTLRIIEGLSQSKLKNISFIGGHVGFGFHEKCIEEVIYISFVRNPLERLISDYKEHCKKGRFFYDILLKNNFNFNVYLNAVKEYKLDNIMTRQLAGPYDFFLRDGIEVGEKLLDLAKFNSESVLFFDMNNFDGALKYLSRNFGWHKQGYQPKNISPSLPYDIDINNELLKWVIQYDIELYRELKFLNMKKTSWLIKFLGG